MIVPQTSAELAAVLRAWRLPEGVHWAPGFEPRRDPIQERHWPYSEWVSGCIASDRRNVNGELVRFDVQVPLKHAEHAGHQVNAALGRMKDDAFYQGKPVIMSRWK